MISLRTPLIVGNWKMHGTLSQALALVDAIKIEKQSDIEIVILPPFVHLAPIGASLAQSEIRLGAQNLYLGDQGAFTGEISGFQLADLGCRYVLVGHSERRMLLNEDNEFVGKKFLAAIEHHLIPILCVGETLQQREAKQTEEIIWAQIESVIKIAGLSSFKHAVIAYEPVWAIGTGVTAKPDEAQAVHHFIRQKLKQMDGAIANANSIIYGGSMKPENAKDLLSMPDIEGGLIGGASLNAAQFLAICQAANVRFREGDGALQNVSHGL